MTSASASFSHRQVEPAVASVTSVQMASQSDSTRTELPFLSSATLPSAAIELPSLHLPLESGSVKAPDWEAGPSGDEQSLVDLFPEIHGLDDPVLAQESASRVVELEPNTFILDWQQGIDYTPAHFEEYSGFKEYILSRLNQGERRLYNSVSQAPEQQESFWKESCQDSTFASLKVMSAFDLINSTPPDWQSTCDKVNRHLAESQKGSVTLSTIESWYFKHSVKELYSLGLVFGGQVEQLVQKARDARVKNERYNAVYHAALLIARHIIPASENTELESSHLSEVVDQLNACKCPCITGKKWSLTTVQMLLERYIGSLPGAYARRARRRGLLGCAKQGSSVSLNNYIWARHQGGTYPKAIVWVLEQVEFAHSVTTPGDWGQYVQQVIARRSASALSGSPAIQPPPPEIFQEHLVSMREELSQAASPGRPPLILRRASKFSAPSGLTYTPENWQDEIDYQEPLFNDIDGFKQWISQQLSHQEKTIYDSLKAASPLHYSVLEQGVSEKVLKAYVACDLTESSQPDWDATCTRLNSVLSQYSSPAFDRKKLEALFFEGTVQELYSLGQIFKEYAEAMATKACNEASIKSYLNAVYHTVLLVRKHYGLLATADTLNRLQCPCLFGSQWTMTTVETVLRSQRTDYSEQIKVIDSSTLLNASEKGNRDALNAFIWKKKLEGTTDSDIAYTVHRKDSYTERRYTEWLPYVREVVALQNSIQKRHLKGKAGTGRQGSLQKAITATQQLQSIASQQGGEASTSGFSSSTSTDSRKRPLPFSQTSQSKVTGSKRRKTRPDIG